MASKCEEYDPEWQYAVELFNGPRENVYDRAMAAGMAGFAVKVEQMSPEMFTRTFSSDLLEVGRYLPEVSQEEAIRKIFGIHHRHARQANSVIDAEISANADAIRTGALPETCLLSMIGRKEHLHIRQILDSDRRTPTRKKKKRGRPPDPVIARRDKKMLEAWQTGQYRTYAELADAFDVPSGDAARKAVRGAECSQLKK